MTLPPLRAVILDNDETTGSYGLVFSILSVLEKCNNVTPEQVEKVLQRLMQFMVTHNVFRPGLRTLLQVIAKQRETYKLDAVIMYTNQHDCKTIFSVPNAIAYMMEYLIGESFFDYILARPPIPDASGNYTKQFKRVLDRYLDRPLDIRQMVFIDDMAHADFVRHDGIPKSATNPSCWVRIEPYKRLLSLKDIEVACTLCLASVFGPQAMTLVPHIVETYQKFAPEASSTPNAGPFLNLSFALQKRFGYVERTSPLRVYIKQNALDKTGAQNESKTSQTNGRKTEGEHHSSQ